MTFAGVTHFRNNYAHDSEMSGFLLMASTDTAHFLRNSIVAGSVGLVQARTNGEPVKSSQPDHTHTDATHVPVHKKCRYYGMIGRHNHQITLEYSTFSSHLSRNYGFFSIFHTIHTIFHSHTHIHTAIQEPTIHGKTHPRSEKRGLKAVGR